MKRYLVFAGKNYYPGGGWSDFRGAFDDLESAAAEAARLVLEPKHDEDAWGNDGRLEWSHCVDLVTGQGEYIRRDYDDSVSRGLIWRDRDEKGTT